MKLLESSIKKKWKTTILCGYVFFSRNHKKFDFVAEIMQFLEIYISG